MELFFTVNGVWRAFRSWDPVVDGDESTPRSPEDTMPAHLTEEARHRLIANGTYHEDGTVNLETAERMGWVALWQEQSARSQGRTGGHRRSPARAGWSLRQAPALAREPAVGSGPGSTNRTRDLHDRSAAPRLCDQNPRIGLWKNLEDLDSAAPSP